MILGSDIMATIDIKIQNQCNHRISSEFVSLDADGVTLRPSAPIISMGSLSVRRFGEKVDKNRYSLELEDNAIYSGTYKAIKLSKRDKYTDPVYEITYATSLNFCPKCAGTRYTDDMYTLRDGEIKNVSGTPLLAQQAEKHVVTDSRSNKYHPWIGSGLRDLIGTKVADFDFIDTEIKRMIRQSLTNMKNAQQKHEQANPIVSEDEILGNIVSIEIVPYEDPTIVEAFVNFTSASGKTLQYQQTLELSTFRPR
jgi:hypothetical protein